ncbi:MAG TPA: phosphopantetheine-binding protein [Actinocrinis sp.]|nr:phosphopantetheine-binding protein [Actinocrinis sp.]
MDFAPDGGRAAAERSAALADLTGLLARVTGEGESWAQRIGPDTALEADLGVDSVEFVVLNALLRGRYGDAVDLLGLLRGLDLDQIIGLTVGDLLAHLGAVGDDGSRSATVEALVFDVTERS